MNNGMKKTAVSTRVAGLAVLLIGLVVLAGWVLHKPELIRLYSENSYTVINSALCFVVSGLSLVLTIWMHRAPVRRLRNVLLLAVMVLSGLTLIEIWANVDLGIDLVEFHRQYQISSAYPGRITPNAALGFFLFSLATLLDTYSSNDRARLLVRLLTAAVFVLGLTGIVAYLLDLQNLYPEFYPYTGIARMTLQSGCGLTGLGVGLWGLWYHDWLHGESRQDIEVRRIYHSSILVISVLGMATGITGFSFLQSTLQKENAFNLLRLHTERNTFFQTIIGQAQRQLVLVTDDLQRLEYTVAKLRREPDNTILFSHLRDLIAPHGNQLFSGIALEMDGQRWTLSGQLIPQDSFSLPLKTSPGQRLAWNQGYFLEARQALHDVDGNLLGELVIDQALPQLDDSQADTKRWGKTGEMTICGQTAEEGGLNCFPTRASAAVHDVPDHFRRQPLAMLRALQNETGAGVSLDADGQRVMAAYGPIGQTGLGLVIKMTVAEIYGPIRRQLEQALPVIGFLMLLGLWIIHARVRPLVLKLVATRVKAEQARSNFVAAAESSPDAFFILDSYRNVNGEIVDFRFAYLNHHIKKAFPGVVDDVTGMSYRQRFPHRQDFFDKYCAVANTGVMLDEEFDWEQPDGTHSWINLQAVCMPNGIAVTWRDLTHKKQNERLLEESNHLRAAILDSAPYSIITSDTKGVIQSFNKAAEQMLQYRAEELVGKQRGSILHDRAEIAEYAAQLSEELGIPVKPGPSVFVLKVQHGLVEDREWSYIRKDGSRLPVRLVMTALRNNQGCITGYLGMGYDVTEQKRLAEHTRYVSLHDVLTGLPNRALLADRVEGAIKQSNRHGRPFALAVMDIDRFKHINDSLGHYMGDQVLVEFVQRVVASVRPTDTVARMGGDEFVLLLPECTGNDVGLVLERIFEALKPSMRIEAQDLHVTTSIGISIYPEHGVDLDTLMRQADTAMYWVKEQGRNGYRVFSPEIDQGKEDRLRLSSALHQAVEEQAFKLVYQPLIDLRQRKIIGVEALLRWQRPDGSYVSPASFIPIAEDNGLILQIGTWVLNQACRDAVRFQEKLGERLHVAVNVSPRQFVQGDLIDHVRAALDAAGLMPNLLELEITEGILMNQHINAADQLRALNELGVGIAIDDFGTGYSSLSYLKRFPISKLKIDQSFVRDVMTDPEDAVLAGAIISMGHSLNISIVAEGVETREQFEFLMRNWCDIGQGYYFARPQSFDDFVAWYEKRDFIWQMQEMEFILVE